MTALFASRHAARSEGGRLTNRLRNDKRVRWFGIRRRDFRDRGARHENKGIREPGDILLCKSESWAIILSGDKFEPTIEPTPHEAQSWRTERNSRLRHFAHNLRRESIFLFFACNPLKSPDSDE
jgi:hypothetical protein